MKHPILIACAVVLLSPLANAQDEVPGSISDFTDTADSKESPSKKSFADRWEISAYVEIAAQRNFIKMGDRSANPLPDYPAWNLYLPKSSLWATFDCGKGWSIGTQIEFINTGSTSMYGVGNASSRPMDWDQELTLSELWVRYSFSEAANIRVGLMGTPQGKQCDYPTQFFSVTRPENGPAFLDIHNQSPAIEFAGASGKWDYSALFLPGFTNFDFGNDYWRLGSGDESYRQNIDRMYAGAFRVNNYSVPGLTLGLSGQVGGGHTWQEYGEEDDAVSRKLHSTLTMMAFDFEYDAHNVVFRGAYQYGYLANKDKNPELTAEYGPVRDMQAMSAGAEIGYDLFSFSSRLNGKQKFYLFGRYDFADYQNHPAIGNTCWSDIQSFSLGVNWMPMKSIIVKAEWGMGFDSYPSRTFAGVSIAWQPSFP